MDVEAIAEALAAAAATVTTPAEIQGFAARPGSIEPPAFWVNELTIDYNQTFSGSSRQLDVTCIVAVMPGSEEDLNGFLSQTSIKAALEADKTLGGVAQSLNVDRARTQERLTPVGGQEYPYAEFDLRIWA